MAGGINAMGWGARTLLLVLIAIMSFSIRWAWGQQLSWGNSSTSSA
jgi:hypothetical protein